MCDAVEAVEPTFEEHPRSLGLALVLLVGGLIGVVAAIVLMVEKMALAADPNYVPTCTFNAVLSCGSVMETQMASAFGIPNPLLGIAGFAVVATIGAGMLAGARFHRWFWIATQVGVTFGVVFVHWLMYQSLYVIGALCLYCMIVWTVMIPIFWFTSVRNLRRIIGSEPAGIRRIAAALTDTPLIVLIAWYLIIAGLVFIRFFW